MNKMVFYFIAIEIIKSKIPSI